MRILDPSRPLVARVAYPSSVDDGRPRGFLSGVQADKLACVLRVATFSYFPLHARGGGGIRYFSLSFYFNNKYVYFPYGL